VTAAIADIIKDNTDWVLTERGTDELRSRLTRSGCYIYGSGGFGRLVAESCAARNIAVHGFIDTFIGGGQLVAGLPSAKPDELNAEAVRASALVVAVNNYAVALDGIAAWAEKAGFVDVLFVPELPDVLEPALGKYWQSSRLLMSQSLVEIERLHDMLADETSREILQGLVRYRITGRPEHHPAVDIEHHYLPVDLPMTHSDISVIDCGAFPGDMVERTAAAGLKLRNWFAFEPDPANFRKLREVAATAPIESASLFPCGVGNSTGLIRFEDGGDSSSRAADDQQDGGGVLVPFLRVDDVVQARRIDLVKLDIEGFELAALEGMTDLLSRHTPRVAAAIYHKPTDLWEIPFKLKSMFPGSRFAIRQHGYSGYETVLYADLAH
jgi:FkbM family methyltransferase